MPATVDCVCLDRLRRAEIALSPPHCGAHPIRHAPVKVEDNSPVSNDDEVRRVAALAMKRGKGLDLAVTRDPVSQQAIPLPLSCDLQRPKSELGSSGMYSRTVVTCPSLGKLPPN